LCEEDDELMLLTHDVCVTSLMSYCLILTAVGADEKGLGMLASLSDFNGLASPVLKF
jgi:hypothetical protein